MTQNFANYCEIHPTMAVKIALLELMVATNSKEHIIDSKGRVVVEKFTLRVLSSCLYSSADPRIALHFCIERTD